MSPSVCIAMVRLICCCS